MAVTGYVNWIGKYFEKQDGSLRYEAEVLRTTGTLERAVQRVNRRIKQISKQPGFCDAEFEGRQPVADYFKDATKLLGTLNWRQGEAMLAFVNGEIKDYREALRTNLGIKDE